MATVVDSSVRETARLIASDKVEGTAVRRTNGDKVGSIQRIMIEKSSGRAAYAVMSSGGILGIGADYIALPWSLLRYNERLDAYELNISDDQLRGAPASASGFFQTGTTDRSWETSIHDYYHATPYW